MTHATLSKPAVIDFGGMDIDATFAELAAELTAPKPSKINWEVAPVWPALVFGISLSEITIAELIDRAPGWHAAGDCDVIADEEYAQFANAAADALEKHGWIQGRYGHDKIGMCAMGALSHVILAAKIDKFRGSHIFARITDRLVGCTGGYTIPGWNDQPMRTKEDVVTAFRTAAASFTAS